MSLFKYLCLIALTTLSLQSLAQNTVDYKVTVTDADHHLAQVIVQFPKVEAGTFNFALPVWRTGKYKILDLANGISQLQVSGKSGLPLQVKKISKNQWQLDLVSAQTLKVTYQLYADSLKDRARHIDDSHMFLDASAGLIFSEKFRHNPIEVSLNVPKDWQSRSGMEKSSEHTFIAPNYDVLVDSPIESGIHQFRQFKVGERDYELVVWGQGNYDLDEMIEDFTKLDKAAEGYWGDFPFKRYVYMLHIAPGIRGATEHLNSTIMHSTPYRFKKRKDYLGFIQTSAHEFVHTWNVKAYRPKGITPYNYHKENYSPLFWIAEGSTSYLQQILGVRAETITQKEFLQALAKNIDAHRSKAGRQQMSVAQASFDAWINSDHTDSSNHQVSIYQQGMLVTLMLDYEIRRRTQDKKSLQDLHKALYQQNKPFPKSYNEKEVLAILKELTASSFEGFWDDYVYGLKELPLEQALAYFGLQRVDKSTSKAKNDKETETEIAETEKVEKKSWSGLSLASKDGFPMVSNVIAESPAWKAGLANNDLIVSINQMQATTALEKRLEEMPAKTAVEFVFFRKGRLKTTQLELIQQPNPPSKLIPLQSFSDLQSSRFYSLTGQSLSKKK